MTNIAELERVMTFIKDNPEKHDQKVWANECGTAACFAGWACFLNGYSVDAEKIAEYKANGWTGFATTGGPALAPGGKRIQIQEGAREVLGLGGDDAYVLFSANNTVEDLELMVKDLSNGDHLSDRWMVDSDGRWHRKVS